MKHVTKWLSALALGAFALLPLAPTLAPAHAKEAIAAPKAKAAYLIDVGTGTPLAAHNERAHYPIASMVKIMTVLLSLEHIESGKLGFDSEITVSQNAASMGGSQAFLDANATYKVDNLLRSIVVASANDSCVAMAEQIAGSTEGFVDAMNQRAKELQMPDTNFVNCTGLPKEGGYSCAKDVAAMMRALAKHQDYFRYSTVWMDDFTHPGGRITGLTNTNKLVRFYEGCDGGKTGFTSEAKFCLAATAKRNGLRLVSVVIGADDSKTRFAEVSRLLNTGFAGYENKVLYQKGQVLEKTAAVENGKQESVKVRVADDVGVFGARGKAAEGVTTQETLNTLKAPVKAGDVVGTVVAAKDGAVVAQSDLVADAAVEKRGFKDNWRDVVEKMASAG
ncbi:MAG: D-alanyl-D-alanine carboxypeptidase [Clostridiales bacterium]|jgi:D-alanyl-D-alanine carboxypeptidase (penicillin-binding protein 5/6)|nr:D-alanyl-D-alanine carboxypeptidase [Clostridiales bacterium]